MSHFTFLHDLAIVMVVAALASLLFRQLKQPVVLGYILAGVIIGPHIPPFDLIADEQTIDTLAELGIIFLMFSLGLDFSFRKLKKVGITSLIAALTEISVMILAGYGLGRLFGWSKMDSIFLGAIISISSTMIIIITLNAMGKTKEHFANLIFGILVFEDILGIVMIALLSGYAVTGEMSVTEVGSTILQLGSFLGVLLVSGLIIVPRLLAYVSKFRSDEMLLISVMGLCFGVSLITVQLGYSVALGAFLIGAIIAEAKQIAKIEQLMHPVRDLFSAVFFVSIGLLIDPKLLIQYAGPILLITIVVASLKPLASSFGCFLAGNDARTSLRVGMGLSQIGEFSFIIASLGLTYKVTSDFLYPIAVAVSTLTTFLTPSLIRNADKTIKFFNRSAPRPLISIMEAYTQWIGHLAQQAGNHFEGKILRKLFAQIAINLFIIAAIFISAGFTHGKLRSHISDFPFGGDGLKAIFWLTAAVISLPMLIACWRKIEVVAMVLSEMSVGTGAFGSHTQKLHALISSLLTIVGTGILFVIVTLLSWTIIPSLKVLLVALLIAILCGVLLYRSAVKLYAGAQYALHDTFAHPIESELPQKKDIPQGACSLSLVITGKAIALGKQLSELNLRKETGASIIYIQRAEKEIINPGPKETLEIGDQITLIGSPEQIQAAEKFFSLKK